MVGPTTFSDSICCFVIALFSIFLSRDAFVRTNRRAIVMMFVHMFVCLSVCHGDGVHCDHTVYVSTNLSLWLDSPMFWAP